MAHLLSIVFWLGLLAGLAALLTRIIQEQGPAIRGALAGSSRRPSPIEGALERIGPCLRASFPTQGQQALSPDLGRLLRQLSAQDLSPA